MIEPFGDHTECESNSTYSQSERHEDGRQGKQRQGQTGATETGKAQPKGKTKSQERQKKNIHLIRLRSDRCSTQTNFDQQSTLVGLPR
jgi:hypothetical protein